MGSGIPQDASDKRDRPKRGFLGPYAILEEMGKGGVGTVYRCLSPSSEIPVAIKLLSTDTEMNRALFRAEIAALKDLNRFKHPGIVPLVDSQEEGKKLWYAMEFIEGPPLLPSFLSSSLGFDTATAGIDSAPPITTERKALPDLSPSFSPNTIGHIDDSYLELLLTKVRDLAATLAFLHGQGYVHCDLKPQNILSPSVPYR